MSTYENYLDKANEQELTKEKIMELAAWQSEFMSHAEDQAERFLETQDLDRAYVQCLYVEGHHIIVNYEMSYCGSIEYDSIYMPTSYLWNDDWYEDAIRLKEKRKEEEARQREREEKVRERARTAADLEQLAQLKAKYEGSV